MGEAKRRAAMRANVIYHHTSTLRTNLIWMSGVIQLEGHSKGAQHPVLGEILTDVSARRPCVDFPPLAWFTSEIRVPNVLLDIGMIAQPEEGGDPQRIDHLFGADARTMTNGLALHRVALGFPIDQNVFMRWAEHPGYATTEGQELNETARDAGDDPDCWFVADVPVDVLRATEIWTSGSIFKPKLERRPDYLKEVHRMVQLCRAVPGAHIPPTWISDPTVQKMIEASRSRLY